MSNKEDITIKPSWVALWGSVWWDFVLNACVTCSQRLNMLMLGRYNVQCVNICWRQVQLSLMGNVRYLVINQSIGRIKNLTWRWSSWMCVTDIMAIHPIAVNSSLHHRYLPCHGANWTMDFCTKLCANSPSRYCDIPLDGLKIWPADGLVN